MVMKRYPHGVAGEFFFMKRAPAPRPAWVRACAVEHESGKTIDSPVIDDLPSLLWVINLGCIDLNQWYATCADVDRPDDVHFDLEPGVGATFAKALAVELASRHPVLMTSEYRVAKRPKGRVLADYNQNAWGRTPLLAARGRTALESFLAAPPKRPARRRA